MVTAFLRCGPSSGPGTNLIDPSISLFSRSWKEDLPTQTSSNDFLPFSGSPPDKPTTRGNGHPCHLVESMFELESMCNHLMRENLLVVSYKAHAEQSYQFVCLLQISTRAADFFVDTTLHTRHQLSSVLSKILCSPAITKIVFDQATTLAMLHNLIGLDLTNVLDVSGTWASCECNFFL